MHAESQVQKPYRTSVHGRSKVPKLQVGHGDILELQLTFYQQRSVFLEEEAVLEEGLCDTMPH